MESLEEWIDRQYRYAAQAMLKSISRVDLVKSRPGFGQSIRAAPGSIVASPVFGDWNPQPDYFFHWFRDSALIVDALRLLFEAGDLKEAALTHLKDFVRFSLALQTLDGRALIATPSWRTHVATEFIRYLRDDASLAPVQGKRVVADTRVNPDGTLDISSWARPQQDGAPLRALALLRWMRAASFDTAFAAQLAQLVRADLDFTLHSWHEPSFDMWEEEQGLHYHSLRVSAAALAEGAAWLESNEEPERAQACRVQEEVIQRKLDSFWLADRGFYRSRMLSSGERSAKELDISVILAAIHAQGAATAHTPHDPRIHATLERLEALFAAAYPINHRRPAGAGPAMGRYDGDIYFSGGAYYFSTLGAAELCFRAAAGSESAAAWIERGDAYLATVRAFTPPGGEMSEQFDQRTGAQSSAPHLAWSYAAFVSCIVARRECRER
jgi:glucoamylase